MVGGVLSGSLSRAVTGVSTDSRLVKPGDAFFAVVGERVDGHDYCEEALRRGAACAVIARDVPLDGPAIRVADTVLAMGMMARAILDEWRPVVVGITGSVGKTTAKLMAGLALGATYRTEIAPENLNTEIGVPLAIANADQSASHLVLEFAMRGPGQIRYLAEMTTPRIAVVTNVGISHIELLGTREAIAAAKRELFEAMDPDGVACINADDHYAEFLRSAAPGRCLTFGMRAGSEVRATDTRSVPGGVEFVLEHAGRRAKVTLQAPGRHLVNPALCAAAVAVAAGVSLEGIATGLAAFQPGPHRGTVLRSRAGYVVIDDTYNAAPDSMAAALAVLSEIECPGRRIAVVGDMRELGELAPDQHRRVGAIAAQAGVEVLIAVGEWAQAVAHAAEQAGLPADQLYCCAGAEEARELALRVVRPGDAVLVKASRALGLELVVQALVEAGTADG